MLRLRSVWSSRQDHDVIRQRGRDPGFEIGTVSPGIGGPLFLHVPRTTLRRSHQGTVNGCVKRERPARTPSVDQWPRGACRLAHAGRCGHGARSIGRDPFAPDSGRRSILPVERRPDLVRKSDFASGRGRVGVDRPGPSGIITVRLAVSTRIHRIAQSQTGRPGRSLCVVLRSRDAPDIGRGRAKGVSSAHPLRSGHQNHGGTAHTTFG